MTAIPIKIYQVWGDVDLSFNNLKSLKGAPVYIWGNLNCSENELTSFKDGPYFVQKKINCLSNQIASLDYWPINGLDCFDTLIHKSFNGTSVVAYDYILKHFFWKPEFTLLENIDQLLKYCPSALNDLNETLAMIPGIEMSKYRGAVLGSNIGII